MGFTVRIDTSWLASSLLRHLNKGLQSRSASAMAHTGFACPQRHGNITTASNPKPTTYLEMSLVDRTLADWMAVKRFNEIFEPVMCSEMVSRGRCSSERTEATMMTSSAKKMEARGRLMRLVDAPLADVGRTATRLSSSSSAFESSRE